MNFEKLNISFEEIKNLNAIVGGTDSIDNAPEEKERGITINSAATDGPMPQTREH